MMCLGTKVLTVWKSTQTGQLKKPQNCCGGCFESREIVKSKVGQTPCIIHEQHLHNISRYNTSTILTVCWQVYYMPSIYKISAGMNIRRFDTLTISTKYQQVWYMDNIYKISENITHEQYLKSISRYCTGTISTKYQ